MDVMTSRTSRAATALRAIAVRERRNGWAPHWQLDELEHCALARAHEPILRLAGVAKAAVAGRLFPSRRIGLPNPAAVAVGAQHRRHPAVLRAPRGYLRSNLLPACRR